MKRILILTGDGGESYETLYAKHRFEEEQYEATIAAPSKKLLNLVMHDFEPGWDTYVERKGYYVESDIAIADAKAEDYDAILIIGGRAPEFLRNDPHVIALVQAFNEQEKYIFAICHGIQVLVTAGLVKDKNITCYEHVKFEVTSCGGTFIGKDEAVQDGRIVTGQTWQSHPDFYRMVMRCLREKSLA
ncbi:MAG: DJ-1/PfpI family protein [Bacteroidota bacterium]